MRSVLYVFAKLSINSDVVIGLVFVVVTGAGFGVVDVGADARIGVDVGAVVSGKPGKPNSLALLCTFRNKLASVVM